MRLFDNKYSKKRIKEMLRESNAIEGIYDEVSLQDAIKAWNFLDSKRALTVSNVKEAHAILMAKQEIPSAYKGDFRDIPVTIGGQLKTLPKPVIESLIIDLLEDVNNREPGFALPNHVHFENIHPFYDGNGRIGRIIMNWEQKKKDLPLIVFTEKLKEEEYYPIFRRGF